MRFFWPALAALPWLLGALTIVWRARGGPSLADQSAQPPASPPLISVVLPARNEARCIERCVRSILASDYPALELIVVDDRSEDDTATRLAAIAAGDARLTLVRGEPLPDGWFGKQWACTQGARVARGGYLCFTDADTVHAPDLLGRAVNAMRERRLDFLTVGGRQELVTFWERVVQPLVFTMLLARYGGAARVNRSGRVEDKIANGQFLLMSRSAYDAIGGHAAVRTKVAEDVALAQLMFTRGHRTELVVGLDQLSTRMYTSLGEIIEGWGKNIYVASFDVVPHHPAARALIPAFLIAPAFWTLLPVVGLLGALLGFASPAVALWGALCVGVMLIWWAAVYVRVLGLSPLYAFAFPLSAAVVLYIVSGSIARGKRVRWKGRVYEAAE